jgi:aspartate-semialdehyde dehydrogenase
MRGYRVGVIGPGSPFGQRVRARLEEGELPVVELKLFTTSIDGVSTLTQFGDDVVLTQPLDPDLLPHLDVLFVAGEESDLLNRTARSAAEEGVLTLVEGAVGLDGPVVTVASSDVLRGGERLGRVPRVSSYLLGVTLQKLVASYSLSRAVATVLVPAHALGDRGADELHQQVVHILNFKTPPTDVFHEQLAFNVRLAGATADAAPAMAEAVALEASSLAGAQDVLTVNLVQVPVFHGYSASLWVELAEPVEARELKARFGSKPFATFPPSKSSRSVKAPSPVAIAASESVHVGPIRKGRGGGPSGFWIWLVADTTAYDPAGAAVEIATKVLS